jgi:hypothetical protein
MKFFRFAAKTNNFVRKEKGKREKLVCCCACEIPPFFDAYSSHRIYNSSERIQKIISLKRSALLPNKQSAGVVGVVLSLAVSLSQILSKKIYIKVHTTL